MSTRRGFLARALAGVAGAGLVGAPIPVEAIADAPHGGAPVRTGYMRGAMLARMCSRAPVSMDEVEAAHLLGATRGGFQIATSMLADDVVGLPTITTVTGALEKGVGERKLPVQPILLIHSQEPSLMERIMVLEGRVRSVDFDASGARHIDSAPSVLMRWEAVGSLRFLNFDDERVRRDALEAASRVREGRSVPFVRPRR